jgi:hypothetical protein
MQEMKYKEDLPQWTLLASENILEPQVQVRQDHLRSHRQTIRGHNEHRLELKRVSINHQFS